MTKPSLTLILPLCVALATACTGDDVGVAPQLQNQRVLTRIAVTPSSTDLLPGRTRQLRIQAFDQFSEIVPEPFEGTWADKAKFSSSAPEIAAVSSSGLVTGLAPGAARITVTLSLGGVTKTGSITTEVWEDTYSGVYNLTAPITDDRGFGYLDNRYTAVLVLRQDPNNPPGSLEGTYEGLQIVGPDGVSRSNPISGRVTGWIKLGGEVAIFLYQTNPASSLAVDGWSGKGMLASGQAVGKWATECFAVFPDQVCSSRAFAGTFTAVRK